MPKISGFAAFPFNAKQWLTALVPIWVGMPPKPKTGKLRSASYGSTIEPTMPRALSY